MIVLYNDCLDCKHVKFAGGIGFCDREECEFKNDNNDEITTNGRNRKKEIYS